MDLDISIRLMLMENDIYLEISSLKYSVDWPISTCMLNISHHMPHFHTINCYFGKLLLQLSKTSLKGHSKKYPKRDLFAREI